MNLPQRKNIRLEKFDYSQQGAYFVTLCTQNRQQLFEIHIVGNDLRVVPKNMPLQNQIIYKWLHETENKFNNIKFDRCVIMPDHLHFIVNITERHAGRSLQDVIQFFKTMTTNDYIKAVRSDALKPFHKKLWQKSYYDHVIRSEQDYREAYEYIENNPIKWIMQKETQGR